MPTDAMLVQNHLIRALLPELRGRLCKLVQPAILTARETISAQDSAIENVHFVLSGMVSMVAHLVDGSRSEVGVIGREGLVGAALIAGVDTVYTEAIVQISGTALRMRATDFTGFLDAEPAFRNRLLRYSEALHAQVMQTAVCNAKHSLEQRLSRWLLMAQDRAGVDELALSQDFIAVMLGVQRPSLAVTAGALRRAAIIRTSPAGRVTILDRAKLERTACECYAAVQRRFVTLLGPYGLPAAAVA